MDTTPVLPTRTLTCPPAPKKQRVEEFKIIVPPVLNLPKSKSVGALPIPLTRSYAFRE